MNTASCVLVVDENNVFSRKRGTFTFSRRVCKQDSVRSVCMIVSTAFVRAWVKEGGEAREGGEGRGGVVKAWGGENRFGSSPRAARQGTFVRSSRS